MTLLSTSVLTATDGGTRMEYRVKMQTRLPNMVTGPMCRMVFKKYRIKEKSEALARYAEDEHRSMAAEPQPVASAEGAPA